MKTFNAQDTLIIIGIVLAYILFYHLADIPVT